MITKFGSICAHAGEASSHFTPENMIFNFTFYGYFELFVPNNCPHGCASILCNCTEKLSAWRNQSVDYNQTEHGKVSNLWLQHFKRYLAFPLLHRHFWSLWKQALPTCSTFLRHTSCLFHYALSRAELWWGLGCQCALMPWIWPGKEGKASASHLVAEWKQKCFPTTGVTLAITKLIF